MSAFIDSHAHITGEEFLPDLEEVLGRAAAAGVAGIVCPGTNVLTSRDAVAAASRHPTVRAAVGIHPHEAGSAAPDAFGEIEALAASPGVVAIGEIGLDYHYDFAPRDVQREAFRRQLEIAARVRLPVVIHSREAEEDTVALVADAVAAHPEWRGRPGADPEARGVFHCFPGDAAMAERVIGLGFYVSFPGPITFPAKPSRPNRMAEVAAAVPLARVLLETDSPWLTPHPFRGKRNEPANIPLVAQRLAELTGRPLGEIGAVTSANAANLFGWSPV